MTWRCECQRALLPSHEVPTLIARSPLLKISAAAELLTQRAESAGGGEGVARRLGRQLPSSLLGLSDPAPAL